MVIVPKSGICIIPVGVILFIDCHVLCLGVSSELFIDYANTDFICLIELAE